VPALKPWRTALGGGGRDALELNAGEAERSRIQPGDEMDFGEIPGD
jgi:uncharacterized membrane protein (UPF0127 family)